MNSFPIEGLGVTSDDKDIAEATDKEIFSGGFSDREFTWHFAGAMAGAAVNRFAQDKKISENEAGELTLGDWADVIGSMWFSKLMHQLAFTRNGLYRRFGQDANDYLWNSFEEHLEREGGIDIPAGKKGLIVRERAEPLEGFMYLTAELDPEIREKLRALMRQSRRSSGGRGSTGCPVARRSTRMAAEHFVSDLHAETLVKNGILSVRSRSEETVHVEQEATAIDRTLELIAWQLDEYDRLYGTPRIALSPTTDARDARAQLVHEHRPKTDALKRPEPRLLWRY
ncbi:MAG TPA: hypothetical protein VHA05_03075 [Candidatus Saccharimonadales bacterium]|nr:hypothetical protein [Candidatus Saccharimonadales bacterium]